MDNKDLVKQLIANGVTADELTSLLNDAEKEHEKELAAKEALIDARQDAIYSLVEYFIQLGVVDKDIDEDDLDDVYESLGSYFETLEKNFKQPSVQKDYSHELAEMDKIFKAYQKVFDKFGLF